MLAVFKRSSVEVPEELTIPGSNLEPGKQGEEIAERFVGTRENGISIRLEGSAFLAYTLDRKETLLLPRSLASVEDIYCIFVGTLENLWELRRRYGLSKTATEAMVVIEAYRTLRDRGPYPADQVVKEFRGRFAFVLFDAKSSSVFAAADADRSVTLFWGTAGDGSLVFSDDSRVLRNGCGKSYAPFPAGCIYSSVAGLQSFEHPLHKMKAMPRVDSEGHLCGANFRVDTFSKLDTIPRVGSSANWALDS